MSSNTQFNLDNHLKGLKHQYLEIQATGLLEQASRAAKNGEYPQANEKLGKVREILGNFSGDFLKGVESQITDIEKIINVYNRSQPVSKTTYCEPKLYAKIALLIGGALSLAYFPLLTAAAAVTALVYKIYSSAETLKERQAETLKERQKDTKIEEPPKREPITIELKEASQYAIKDHPPAKIEEKKNLPGQIRKFIKVELKDASQYTMNGNRPAACTFHAVKGAIAIGKHFDQYVKLLEDNSSERISNLQREILQEGLSFYEKAVAKDRKFLEGADIEDIKKLPANIFPKELRLQDQITEVVYPNTLKGSLAPIADHLCNSRTESSNSVLMTNSNAESFSLVSKGDQVIIFDSHKNELILTRGKDMLIDRLAEKLHPYIGEMNTINYALAKLAID